LHYQQLHKYAGKKYYLQPMKKLLLPFLFVGTMVMIYVMAITSTTLKTAATPIGILNLEFAYNNVKTAAVVKAWAPNNTIDNISVAKNNTYYDFIFLGFYASFLFFTGKKIAQIKNSTTGMLIAKGAIAAGVLDIAENAGMLMTLSGNASGTIALLTVIFSVIKWLLAITAAFYCVAGIVYLFRYKKFNMLFT
jgi:hypothetical protein